MTIPTVAFYPRHLCVDKDSLQELADQRYWPPVQDQRRDSNGQFLSHRDLPGTEQREK